MKAVLKPITYVFIMIMLLTSCSPEEKIRDYMDIETKSFLDSDRDYMVCESIVDIYNTSANVNYLANEKIKDLAISYATYLGFAENSQNEIRKYNSSTKLDDDYDPNWFERTKTAEKEADEYTELANTAEVMLLQLKDSISQNQSGGIWVYHEIIYKEYTYKRYAGPYTERRLYLFSENGEDILWSNKVRFSNDIFRKTLNITNTEYDIYFENNYTSIRTFVIAIILALIIALAIWNYQRKAPIRKEKVENKKAERQQIESSREEVRERSRMDFEYLLENRTKEYGCMTKKISFCYNKSNDIFVYEQAKTIFISGNKYDFMDILSCRIDKKAIKGQTTYTTIPDKHQMAEEQVLWGMGQKYNVKTTTQTKTTPDITIYYIYIGINSLTTPQISLTLHSSVKANEINSLMNVIINLNNK